MKTKKIFWRIAGAVCFPASLFYFIMTSSVWGVVWMAVGVLLLWQPHRRPEEPKETKPPEPFCENQ
jgi:predicted membrane protein